MTSNDIKDIILVVASMAFSAFMVWILYKKS